ncbi:MAG: amino acid permease [candidate division WOR-3 bacterium]|nr:amino acid permease [candidate division WOR-3 bacterium]
MKKELTLLSIFCIASGAMISSGLFVLPGIAFAKAGPAALFSYLLAGILMVPAFLTKAEMATAMPKAGGTYFFVERSLGALAGTLAGFASWFSTALKSAFALVGIGAFAILMFPGLIEIQMKIIACVAGIVFTIINVRSVRETGRTQVAIVLGLIAILILYTFWGISSVKVTRFTPFVPFGFTSVFATAGLVFISYGGLTKIASVSEEVKDPKRTIPLGLILSFAVVLFLYLIVMFVTIGVTPKSIFSGSLTPISDGARRFSGMFGVVITAIGAILAFVSTANAGILAASRVPFAMSRDRLLPSGFEKMGYRFKTPYVSILFTSGFIMLSILFLNLEELVKAASTMHLILFILNNLSLIVMRESKIRNYRPTFRCPFYPWIQIIGIIGYIVLIVGMGKLPLLLTAGFVIFGVIWYFTYAKGREARTSALVHLVERAATKDIPSRSLEEELKEILLERDEIVGDRFDRLVKECEVLDIKGPLSLNEFFKRISRSLSKHINMSEDELYELFIKREKESTTALRPGLAVPHIIIPGEKKFEILLVRCKEGIKFSPDLPPVYVAFVFAGTRDERNFHLRTLMSIAQITQEPDFDRRWLQARNKEELRDIVLLSTRERGEAFI